MADLTPVLKGFLLPGSFEFLWLGLLVGVALVLRGRTLGWGRAWLSVLVATYGVMSTPATAGWLSAAWGGGRVPLVDRADAGGAGAIVVLGGGASRYRAPSGEIDVLSESSVLRVLEAARVYQLLEPPWVVVTEGVVRGWSQSTPTAELMRERLVALGVPSTRILVDAQSVSTRDHGQYVPVILGDHQIERIVLVTSLAHVRRAMRVFAAAGVEALASPAPDLPERPPASAAWTPYVPTAAALRASQSVVYDAVGLAYYWFRGWL